MSKQFTKFKRSAVLLTMILFSISAVAAAAPSEDVQPSNPSEDVPEQKPEDVAPANNTGDPLSSIPGLSNDTLPMTVSPPEIPDLPDQASDIAKSVTDTISQAFSDSVNGIGAFLSGQLQGITGSEDDGNETGGGPGTGGPGVSSQ